MITLTTVDRYSGALINDVAQHSTTLCVKNIIRIAHIGTGVVPHQNITLGGLNGTSLHPALDILLEPPHHHSSHPPHIRNLTLNPLLHQMMVCFTFLELYLLYVCLLYAPFCSETIHRIVRKTMNWKLTHQGTSNIPPHRGRSLMPRLRTILPHMTLLLRMTRSLSRLGQFNNTINIKCSNLSYFVGSTFQTIYCV